jgi:hypothetical protein
MIEKHNKLIEEEDFLEKDSNSDFTWFQVQVLAFILNLCFFC